MENNIKEKIKILLNKNKLRHYNDKRQISRKTYRRKLGIKRRGGKKQNKEQDQIKIHENNQKRNAIMKMGQGHTGTNGKKLLGPRHRTGTQLYKPQDQER